MIMTCFAVIIIMLKDIWYYCCVVAPVRNLYLIFVWELEGKRLFRRPRNWW